MKVTPITEDKVRAHFEETNEEPHQIERMLGYAPCNHIHYYDEGKRYYSTARNICEGTDEEAHAKVLVCDGCKAILIELSQEGEEPHKVQVFNAISHERRALVDDDNLDLLDNTP